MKKLLVILMLLASVFVLPLMAQTKFGGSYWNLGSGQAVSGEGTKEKPFTVRQKQFTVPQSEKEKAPQAIRGVVSREEFTKTVTGKTPEEVIKLIGVPVSTSGVDSLYWTYEGKTVDSITGKVDRHIFIVFGHGVRIHHGQTSGEMEKVVHRVVF